MYDIVIVGAGPAGANLARLIGSTYNVLLLDKRDLAEEDSKNLITKCCGGLLAPDAQKMIAQLGLGMPKEILVGPQLFAVKTIDLTNDLERLYQRFYYNMDREKFDRWLISLIPKEVEKQFNASFKGFSEISGGYEIRWAIHGEAKSVKTKLIVGADGASSLIRKSINGNQIEPVKYIAIQEWFACSNPTPYFTAIFDEVITDFYSWIIPKENCLLVGSALTPGKDAREKFELLKGKLTELGFSFDNKLKSEGAFIYRPKKASQFYPGKGGVALVGEAAGAISPSSAEGISYALKSSLFLAQSLEEGLDGYMERYKLKSKEIKFNLLLKNLKSPAMYQSSLRRLAMKSGFQSIR